MKFFNRNQELNLLKNIRKESETKARMTVMVGRRRIGKTRLIQKSLEGKTFIYLFVARKSENLLCKEFLEEANNIIKLKTFGEINSFKSFFELLMDTSINTPFTLVIDEFQEFISINPSVYSDMQNLWDKYKEQSKMNLIMCGSVYSMMKKIFENSKEPLFGRANEQIHLKPFRIETLKEILSEYSPGYTNTDLLALYIFTGNVAKYVEQFVDRKALTFSKMLDVIFDENSLLLNEGKNILIEEFGKEYTTYFSILSLIASSKTSRSDIESILEKNIGGYLDRLDKEYSIIKKQKPVFSKPESRIQKYYIEDNFLNFWFRFIYKYRSAVEIGNYEYLKAIVERDFKTFSGRFLEKYFKEKLADSRSYSLVGNYWEKSNKNEIDIIAVNEMNKKVLFAEVKLNPNNLKPDLLKEKSVKILNKLKGYKIEYLGLSIEDM